MLFSEEILALFEQDGPIHLEERYKIQDPEGVLCYMAWYGINLPRTEVVVVAESDVVIIVLDGGVATLTVTVDQLMQLVPFLNHALR